MRIQVTMHGIAKRPEYTRRIYVMQGWYSGWEQLWRARLLWNS